MEQVAIITGATRGIGRGIFHSLAKRKCKIATVYHHDDEAASKFEDEAKEFGIEYIIDKLDVRNGEDIKGFVNKVITQFGRLDFLVNNVGNDLCKPLTEVTISEWQESHDIIVTAPFLFCKYSVPQMRKQEYGRIINLGASSKDYLSGHAGYGPFSINKGALILLTKTLALEEIRNGITVNIVAPGSTQDSGINPEENRIPISQIPIGRRIKIQEIVSAVEYLLGSNADSITGQVLNVNGGLSV